MSLTPDFDLLAVTYLGQQEAGPRLRDLARMVATYRQNNAMPGKRSARRADLVAAASAARRLRVALHKIDFHTRAAAIDLGIAERLGPVPPVVGLNSVSATSAISLPGTPVEVPPDDTQNEIWPGRYFSNVADALRLTETLETVEAGFAALGEQQDISKGGGPQRPDALRMGLEGLLGFWNHYRAGEPATQSRNERGFAAFAVVMFAAPPVEFDEATVVGAVVALLPRTGVATTLEDTG